HPGSQLELTDTNNYQPSAEFLQALTTQAAAAAASPVRAEEPAATTLRPGGRSTEHRATDPSGAAEPAINPVHPGGRLLGDGATASRRQMPGAGGSSESRSGSPVRSLRRSARRC